MTRSCRPSATRNLSSLARRETLRATWRALLLAIVAMRLRTMTQSMIPLSTIRRLRRASITRSAYWATAPRRERSWWTREKTSTSMKLSLSGETSVSANEWASRIR